MIGWAVPLQGEALVDKLADGGEEVLRENK